MLPFLHAADYEDIKQVGMPRALLYHRYARLFTAFFEGLEREIILSPETDKATLEIGESRSVDECCLASKIYLGHVALLAGRCDAVFVPGFANVGRFASFCTKFQALPDLVANTFYRDGLRLVTLYVNELSEKRSLENALLTTAARFGASPKESRLVVKRALAAQRHHDAECAARFEAKLSSVSNAGESARSVILLVAHPYLSHDRFLGGDVVRMLENSGAEVLLADEADRERAYRASFDFSETMPWAPNRELVGSLLLHLDRVDGIVLMSAFPCGPDSMTNDAIQRCVQGKPMLTLTVDAQSGTAGLETRIESFIDILAYQKKGGYLS